MFTRVNLCQTAHFIAVVAAKCKCAGNGFIRSENVYKSVVEGADPSVNII